MAVLLFVSLGLLSCRGVDWFFLKRSLRSKFGDVDWITTQELADRLAEKDRPPPALLDVRTPAEDEVSHLLGARRVDPNASAEEAAGGLPKDAPIVAYCSVGYRSGQLAERLQRAGFTNVRDLEARFSDGRTKARPLVRAGKKVTQVHPYNATWRRLLCDEVRAPLPSSSPRKAKPRPSLRAAGAWLDGDWVCTTGWGRIGVDTARFSRPRNHELAGTEARLRDFLSPSFLGNVSVANYLSPVVEADRIGE